MAATVLTWIPKAPENILNLSKASGYVLGRPSFRVKNIHVTSIFNRQLGGHGEEVVLGILAVILIAVLSDIVHTLLLSTRRNQVSNTGLQVAYLVDEVSHFRNLLSHATSWRHDDTGQRRRARRNCTTSISVLFTAAMLFAADVLVVFLGQPTPYYSKSIEYEVRGVQPVFVTRGVSKSIRRLSGDRPCITPVYENERQTRHFQVLGCITYDFHEALSRNDDLSSTISIGSWFHSGGSDHNITFGEGWRSVKIRAELSLTESKRNRTKRVRFRTFQNIEEKTRYLHELVIYGAMEWTCNKSFARVPCTDLVSSLQRVSSKPLRRNIVLWRSLRKSKTEYVTGIVTTYQIALNSPFEALSAGLGVLASSGGIREVQGQSSWYTDSLTDREELTIPRLLSEEGRTASVLSLSLALVILIVALGVLRKVLRPKSLASLAYYQLQHVEGELGDYFPTQKYQEPTWLEMGECTDNNDMLQFPNGEKT